MDIIYWITGNLSVNIALKKGMSFHPVVITSQLFLSEESGLMCSSPTCDKILIGSICIGLVKTTIAKVIS